MAERAKGNFDISTTEFSEMINCSSTRVSLRTKDPRCESVSAPLDPHTQKRISIPKLETLRTQMCHLPNLLFSGVFEDA